MNFEVWHFLAVSFAVGMGVGFLVKWKITKFLSGTISGWCLIALTSCVGTIGSNTTEVGRSGEEFFWLVAVALPCFAFGLLGTVFGHLLRRAKTPKEQ